MKGASTVVVGALVHVTPWPSTACGGELRGGEEQDVAGEDDPAADRGDVDDVLVRHRVRERARRGRRQQQERDGPLAGVPGGEADRGRAEPGLLATSSW
ncbi:hypothetical protein [Streptomyces sp. WMMC940]|uniref:hypothetical protein n=1 Tax=Streptomyces sp. WMMC940 TaxID=3015153 RepID=UPI0022B61B14|nr:hypothetical protein [Streptomyces sp. WMMC940]MCZ7459948.1 hypothetical protein [Streptomyces sp. WMMC940]